MTVQRPAAVLLALGLALTGCSRDGDGGGTPAPATTTAPSVATTPSATGVAAMRAPEAVAAAEAAYLAAPSVRVKGFVVQGGERAGLDLHQAAAGQLRGTVTLAGAKLSLIVSGKSAYLSADRKFWVNELGPEEGADAYRIFKGKWAKTTLTGPELRELTTLLDRDQLMADAFTADGLRSEGTVTEVDGRAAVRYESVLGPELYAVHIAAEGRPYPLRIAGDADGDAVDLTFLDYGKPVDVTPPPAADVIDVSG